MLTNILTSIQEELRAAPRVKGHVLREMSLATTDKAGTPRVRTVILRDTLTDPLSLLVFTDARSPKCEEIRRQSNVQMLGYDRAEQIQMRLSGQARIHIRNDVSERYLAELKDYARRDYAGLTAPGSEQTTSDFIVDDQDDMIENHFAVIWVKVTEIDWLKLSRDGHKRAKFEFTPAGVVSTWLTP